MAHIPQEKIDEVRRSVDIVDVVGQYLQLNKSGRNYRTLCPFHDDNDPSLVISPDKQIYRCFVCNTGGNVFSFLMEYLKIPFIEAVKKVAEIGQVDLSGYDVQSVVKQGPRKYEALYKMHTEATRIYSYYLNTKVGNEARVYLTSRHFDDDLIKEFQIGYAPHENVLYSAFEKLEFNDIDMVKSGLVIESSKNFDRFSDRIIFPLHNQEGDVVGFSGRIYKPTQNDSKYLNSPESDIFIKGQLLYHYHKAKDYVRKEGFVYVLEGFMDVIAMYRVGIQNAVAIMGTALTKNHIQALKRLTKHIVLCLDGDRAGQVAMSKMSKELIDAGLDVRIIVLSENHDPDEILEQQGEEALKEVLNKTLKPIEFLMDYEFKLIDINNYDDRKLFLEKICTEISKLEDVVDQDYYMNVLAVKSGFSKEIIAQRVSQQKISEKQPSIHREVRKTIQLIDKFQRAERDLIFYMLLDKNVAMKYEAKAGFMYNDAYRVIASYIVDYYRKHSQIELASFIDVFKDDKLVQLLLEISELDLPLKVEEQAIDDYISIIAENAKKMKKEQLLEQFNHLLDPKQKAEVLSEIVRLENEEETI